MGKVINLRSARKARARDAARVAADANAAQHGRSKAEKRLSKAEAERTEARLDGHKRDGECGPENTR